jgi:flagellar export protein FliJ
MKFVFRLEAPLRLARHHEESSRRALGKAMTRLDSCLRTLASLQEAMVQETEAQSAPRQGEIWVQGQNLFLDWMHGQREKIGHSREACATAEKSVSDARADLVEKRRAVQVLERLRDRRMAQWKLEESRKELAEGSDVAGRRWMAQRRAEAG